MEAREAEANYLERRRRESLRAALVARTTGAHRFHQELARSYAQRLAALNSRTESALDEIEMTPARRTGSG